MDPAKQYLVNCVQALLNLPQTPQGLASGQTLDKFMIAQEKKSLILQYMQGQGLKLFNPSKVDELNPQTKLIAITKIDTDVITEDNYFTNLTVQLLSPNVVTELSNHLSMIYQPLMGAGVDEKIKKKLSGFKQVLQGLQDNDFDNVQTEQRNVSRPIDEIEQWLRISQSATSSESQQRTANQVCSIYQKVTQLWKDVKQLEINKFSDLLDQTLVCLDELYTQQLYNEQKLQGMLSSMYNQIIIKLQNIIPQGQQIFSNTQQQKLLLLECQKMVRMFGENLRKYFEYDWKINPNLQEFEQIEKRLSDLIELRSIYEELKRSNIDQDFFKELFEVNPFMSIGQDSLFNVAYKKVLNNLESAEQDVISLLRQQVFKQQVMKENPLQTIREMQRWTGLLSRNSIQKHFLTERDSLITSITNMISKIEQEFNTRSGAAFLDDGEEEKLPYQIGFSKNIHQIVWCKSLIGKVKRIIQLIQQLFSDIKKSAQFIIMCQNLIKQVQQFEQELFDQWRKEIDSQLKKNEISLQISGKLMEIDMQDGLVRVNYSDKLVQLIKEVRQLCELGYRKSISNEIHTIVETGKKFYKEALTLKSIASFYNQMSDQIIECQKPMLINQAVRFEDTVKNSKKKNSITWENTQELENYVQKVQESANEIMQENKRLRKNHQQIIDNICFLFQVELKQKNLWKEKVDQIKKVIEQTCVSIDNKFTVGWRTHIDFQLYKALEFQYKKGFQEMDHAINEIQADLVIKNGQVMYKPSIEELREKYYNELKKYIQYPSQFVGVGGNNDIYMQMPERNAVFVIQVYEKSEQIFEKLIGLGCQYMCWSVVALLDAEQLQLQLGNMEQWEKFMKEVRQRRKELEKINDYQKVECFNINISFFKQQVDELLTKLVDNMLNELKNQIKNNIIEIEQFLSETQQKLSQKPQNMNEMNEAQKKYVDIKAQKFEMTQKMQDCQQKQKLINSLSSQSQAQNPILIQLQQINKNWENFELLIGDFDSILAEQTKQLKKDMQARAKEIDSEIEKFYSRYSAVKPKQLSELDRSSANELAENMQQWRQQWKQLDEKIQTLIKDHQHFEMEVPTFTQFDKVKVEMTESEVVWCYYDKFQQNINNLGKEDWLSFRTKLYMFQELLLQEQEQIKAELSKGTFTKKEAIINYIFSQIELYLKINPLLKLIVGDAFEPEHWTSLFMILKQKEMKKEKLLFKDLLNCDKLILDKQNDIRELQARAQGEITLREAIFELKTWCDTSEFDLTDYTNNNRVTPLIKEWKELMTKVSDNQSLLASLKESKFIGRFKDQVDQFELKLGGIDEYLSKLQIIQRKWVYLEPIFVRGALPQEQARFRRLDEDFRNIMLGIQRDQKVVSLCSIPGIKDTLDTVLDQLERCQKALNDFLEEKRGKFPRFYFLGDDDLLEILGQSQNPQVIQMHLKKLFAGINSVEFSKDNTQIYSMLSSQKEQVQFNNSIQVNDIVESWLSVLSSNMKETLSSLLKQCLKEQNMDFNKFPSQILCLSEEIKFTEQAVSALNSNKLPQFKQTQLKLLDQFTQLNAQSSNNYLLQLKLKSLVLDLIHHLDIINQLIDNKVSILSDWYWYKQLKYEYQKDAQIIMCKARFDYTYEYQGNGQKLVHTPLTDKCYLTLTQGMSMGYGGNPYGPAGTGKTESVKALGQLFGRQVLVFNCDEGIDFKSMGRIFMGLVKCGAWGCFDEFNRLLEEQLSAISQQIQIIQNAIKENSQSMTLMGQTCNVNKDSGIFVTLNPAGKNYGGRSKLPDNLKQLFRPVAMSIPDNELIAEVLLYSEGFKNAKILAEKIITIFTLSRQLLSPQQHYDWGLRALKTILTVAGQIIQEERKQGIEINETIEAELLIKSIRINTMSKLTYHDTKKFVQLVQDVFPSINSQDIIYEKLTNAIKEVLQSMKLSEIDNQIAKILQFYEATKQRMGVVLVGPSGCGKTTIWKVLKKAHEKLGQQVKTHVMNPKSMPRSQLLGNMNNDTREFSEGVLTASARLVVKESVDVLNWIICDGDIDPEWIESLNSVLDDNHLLTLPTGERISFQNNVNFIFETSDLQYASPATVSRMGMIFLNNEDISMQSLVTRWINKLECEEEKKSMLLNQIESTLYNLLEEIFSYEEQQVVPTTRVGLIMNILSQLQRIPTNKQQFNYLLLQGLSSNFQPDIRLKFQTLINSNLDLNENGDKYQYINQNIDESQFSDVNDPPVIKTVGHQKDLQMLQSWILNNDPFIIVGEEGCGKNLLIQSAFKELKKTIKIQIATINCNAQTSASQIIQKLNQICAKGTSALGRVYKPKDCSRLILYLKDINLPKPDKYQTIQLIAFLQQLITHRGFYDENLEFVYLDDKIQIVSSMNPPSTIGRHQLSTRFTANVRIYYIEQPSNDELQQIYQEYLKILIFKDNNQSKKGAQLLIECYTQIKSKFTVDEQRHYLFTPRTITQIIFALKRYNDIQSVFPEALLNEFNKIFRDKLISQDQQFKFDQMILPIFKKYYKDIQSQQYFATVQNLQTLSKIEKKDFIQLVSQAVQIYSRENRELNVVMIEEVLSLLTSLNRALSSQSQTTLLLAGRNGIGRKMGLQIMSTMLNLEILQPYTCRDYGIREFKRDLKSYMETAQTKNCLLILEDHVLLQQGILETVNSLVSSGEIPGLFGYDEIDRLIQNPEEVKREFYGKTLYEAFHERVKRNMKIALVMDNTNHEFQTNCAQNPALFTNTTIIWQTQLSKESLLQFMKKQLESSNNNNIVNEQLISYAVEIHRNQKADPRSFQSLTQTYSLILDTKMQSKGSQADHLQKGLEKLQEANNLVNKLTQEAQEKKVLLSKKQLEADDALQKISKAMQDAAERRQETEQLQRYLQEEEGKIKVSKDKVEDELRDVNPLVQEAQNAVKGISKSHLDELKSLAQPPPAIYDVLGAVMKVFKQTEINWKAIKKFLGNKQVIDQIIDFDPHMITADIRKDVEEEIAKHSNSFEKQNIYRASLAAGPLADWVKAILKYATVLEKIAPLEKELSMISKKLDSSRNRLKQCQDALNQLDQKVQELKNNFASKTSEAELLKRDLEKAEQTVSLASNLLDKLSGEKVRWQQQHDLIAQELKQFPLDSLLSASYITYLSSQDENVRYKTLQEWIHLTKLQQYDFLKFMSNESQILKWKTLGLPGDQLSIENSVMVFQSSKVSLLIDPNTQATEWLKKTLSGAEILNQTDPKFNNQLELAVRFGKTIVIQEIDQIEGLLIPLLRKDLLHQGPRWIVMIGEKSVDFNESFVMYLTTRNSSIHLPPHTVSLVQVINYTVTRSGLEGKLLSIIINIEQPDLEQKKQQLLENEEKLKMQLADLEKTLLDELANSQGNILENRVLIDSLNQTKSKSQVIAQSLQESSKLQEDLDTQRDVYRPLSQKGAQIFILIQSLQNLNNMYKYSLAYFIQIFQKTLDIKENFDSKQKKLEFAGQSLLRNIFNQIAGSLFKQDRLIFALHLVKGCKPELIEEEEWQFMIGNQIPNESAHLPKWASQDRKEIFGQLQNLKLNINFNSSDWEQWNNNQECEKNFPQSAKLKPFQKVLIVQTFRPERVQSALNEFVCHNLSIPSVSGQTFNFQTVAQEELTAQIPCLFVVSAGSDPSKELEEFAEQQIGKQNFQEMSMGGNQNELALKLIKEAAQKGQWVCLKNLHLVISFLPLLEKTIKQLKPHPNFKLWLTTEAHLKFPSILLETCYKVSYEAPPGLKQNLQRIITSWPTHNKQSVYQTQLLFILTWFHALVQERRTYIPQGWSKFYEFSYADYKAGVQIIENLLQESQTISWQTLYGLYENAIYGGRVDNEQDIKVLRAYLETYFNQNKLQNGTLSTGQQIPQTNQVKDLINLINKLPENDVPEFFGLPNNIDKAVQRYTIQKVVSGLKSMNNIVGSEIKFDKELWTNLLGPLINMWDQLKMRDTIQVTNQQLGSLDPIESFIYLEAQQTWNLYQIISHSFEKLKNVLYNNGLLTSDIIDIGLLFIKDIVPQKWSNFWEGPDDINLWLKIFIKKLNAIKSWIDKIQRKQQLDEVDLSELFHPEIYMNALRQKTARKLNIPLNELKLQADFDSLKHPLVVKLQNLLLQGCGFSNGQLVDDMKITSEFIQLPSLNISYVEKSQPEKNGIGDFPIYLNASREKLLCRIKLLQSGQINDKIIAGVALFLSQND
ncbi:unnamed protein product [Paramecium octaurelia]|uniref:Cytoplasmic dynein 2 heavy chain 1 n=1 Tax=Paramecium octaurelia TaxID=43137 RepID=A0A8S1S364_PAROT|nr:unnamed protein product [Paramecium octaurelia]